MSVATSDNPFSTCVVGLPTDVWPLNKDAIPVLHPHKEWIHNPVDKWDYWALKLPHAPIEPQELEIMGSVKIDFFIRFHYIKKTLELLPTIIDAQAIRKQLNTRRDVSPHHPVYKNEITWCNYTSPIFSWSSDSPLQLPSETFLICEKRQTTACHYILH